MTAAHIVSTLGGRNGVCRCPAHEDRNPSLSVTDRNGKLMVHCHAGCSQAAVIAALRNLGLWPEPARDATPRKQLSRRIVDTYDYCDERGDLLYQIVRQEPKAFLQRFYGKDSKWVLKKHPRQILYRLREVLESPIVFLVEGEKDVETLRGHGFVATTAAGGARAPWLPSFTDTLRGREIILVPDCDAPGRQRAAGIARALLGQVTRLILVDLAEPGVKDVTDWFAAGHSDLELLEIIDQAIQSKARAA